MYRTSLQNIQIFSNLKFFSDPPGYNRYTVIDIHTGNTIFVSIASYRDLELVPTVENLLKNARNPKNIYISLVVQDKRFPDFSQLFSDYGIMGYSYQKIHYTNAKGVGYARHLAQQPISNAHRYYLQIDSHTRMIPDWDYWMIKDHKMVTEIWGRSILSTYPPAYNILRDGSYTVDDSYVPVVKILKADDDIKFNPKYFEHEIDVSLGYRSGYFAAGQAFGFAEDFYNTPYDPDLYFWGEEQTLSLRFYEKGINIICPPRNYLFHDYEGSRRIRHWDSGKIVDTYKSRSKRHIRECYKAILPTYGLMNEDTLDSFMSEFVHGT